MRDKELQFDRSCHVLYTKACKREIGKKIALHYPPGKREEVWLGGLNTNGQLGTEERLGVTDENREIWYTYSNRPDMLTEGIGDTLFADAAVGESHTLLLDRDGNIWSAGNNKNGQLGRPERFKNFDVSESGLSFARVTEEIGNVRITDIAIT